LLTGIKKNQGIRKNPKTGEILQQIAAYHRKIVKEFTKEWIPLVGFQLRYIKFLDEKCVNDLQTEILPYSAIKEYGAKMYKGKRGI
jgi:hypothetical protein